MNTLLAISLLLTPLQTGDIERDCTKYDGDQPTTCEVSLANKLFEYHAALEGCAAAHQATVKQNEKLRQIILTQPPPEEKSEWSLFGLPGWVTPVLAGVLVGGGVSLGLAL